MLDDRRRIMVKKAPPPNTVKKLSKLDKEKLFASAKKPQAQNKRVVKDNEILYLEPKLKDSLKDVALAYEERNALEPSTIPELAYVICTTEPGFMPELKIYNTKDEKNTLIPPKSPLWAKASVQQRQINALRKIVQPAAGRKLNYLESRFYGSQWKLLLKACLSTGKCYFESLESPAVRYGPLARQAFLGLRNPPRPGQLRQFIITEQHAELCCWGLPYYLDKTRNCAGEVPIWEWERWYSSFWSQFTPPQDQWRIIAGLLAGHQDTNRIEQYFPEIFRSLVESQMLMNCLGIPNLCYTLGVGPNAEIPELRAWSQQQSLKGSISLVPIGWDRVKTDGSAHQQYIAFSYEKLLEHTTAKDIADATVSYNSWLEFIRHVVGSKKCYWLNKEGCTSITMGPSLNAVRDWANVKDSDQRKFILYAGTIETQRQAPCVLSWFLPMYANVKTRQLGLVQGLPLGQPLRALRNLESVPSGKATAVSNCIRSLKLENILGLPDSKVEWIETQPRTSLAVEGEHPRRTTFLQFEAPPETCFEQDGITFIKTTDRAWVTNCAERIKAIGFELVEDHEKPLQYKLIAKDDSSWKDLHKEIRHLRKDGFSISRISEQKLAPIEINDSDFLFHTKDSSDGWFSMSLAIKVQGNEVNLLPILLSAINSLPEMNEAAINSLNDKGSFIAALSSGSLISIPFERMKFILMSLHELLSQVNSTDARIKLPAAHALSLLDNEGFSSSTKVLSEGITQLVEQSQRLLEKKPLEASANFKAELRDYQKVGLGWLEQISKLRAGGILADEMGLGKTVQVIAKLALDKSTSCDINPVLVVCPASLIGNWINEIANFAPELRVMQYTGAGRAKLQDFFKFSDVVLTTYQLLLRDQSALTGLWWHGVFLDEAHTIKNSAAAITTAAKELVADYRICLTGTPIENHLGELWSLFDFLMPNMLGSRERFRKFIQKPAEDGDSMAPVMLRKLVSPFVLRRLKEDVLNDLPAKIESIIRVQLTERQLDLYEAIRLLAAEEIKAEIANKSFSPRSPKTVEILTRLRQVCLHPSLCKIAEAKDVKDSAKFQALFERLSLLLEGKRKVLIFSQFVEMLELIGEELKQHSIPYLKLIGDIPLDDRTRIVQEFQETEVQVFLISLLAGGHGLNLTQADTVIIYDPWWNPAKEAQAIDRAHRIGQEKPVLVLRMIAAGTLEEKMMELKSRKLAISKLIYESDDALLNDLTEDDIQSLLGPVTATLAT